MAGMDLDSIESVEQNLKDAGCYSDMIEGCLKCLEKGQLREELRRLERYRRSLLEKLHVEQKKMDCLDYLIYKIRKQL